METSWKHHRNFWLTAVIARLSLKMRTINILHSTTRAAKRDREVRPAVRGRRAKAEESGLPSHLAGPSLRSGPGLASQRLANASSPGTIFCECPPSLRSGSRVTSRKRVKRFKFAAGTLTSFRVRAVHSGSTPDASSSRPIFCEGAL